MEDKPDPNAEPIMKPTPYIPKNTACPYHNHTGGRCMGEFCGVWVKEDKLCAHVAIAVYLRGIFNSVDAHDTRAIWGRE